MEAQLTNYDSVLYPGYTHPQTHPDRLRVIGALFGLEPASLSRCRVLELGCGNGSNLVPMAWNQSQSEFIGIDLASHPVARGQQMIKDLGMANVRLVHGNVTGINDDWGKFDYIIAHGLYSWVPPDVQRQVLNICRSLLAPQGIAFISYNALPGCHMRNMVREMMRFHVRGCDDPEQRVKQALALVRFLADGQPSGDEYHQWIKAELERVLKYDPGHLYHDDLAELNEPLYFGQFMERAAAHGLQYLGEADYFEMSDHHFSASVRQAVGQLGRDRLLREQYLDFLKCRRFRQTLLCHREAVLRKEPLTEKVAGFLVSSAARFNGTPDLRPGLSCLFEAPRGAKVETDLALGKATLTVLETVWPLPLPFDELFGQATERLKEAGVPAEDNPAEREALCGFLLQLFGAGVVEFRAGLPAITRNVSERPVVHPIARWQVQHGNTVASLLHVAIKVEDEIGRNLLCWLDGTLDRKSLAEKLRASVKSQNSETLEQKLNENLEKLARLGLLVG